MDNKHNFDVDTLEGRLLNKWGTALKANTEAFSKQWEKGEEVTEQYAELLSKHDRLGKEVDLKVDEFFSFLEANERKSITPELYNSLSLLAMESILKCREESLNLMNINQSLGEIHKETIKLAVIVSKTTAEAKEIAPNILQAKAQQQKINAGKGGEATAKKFKYITEVAIKLVSEYATKYPTHLNKDTNKRGVTSALKKNLTKHFMNESEQKKGCLLDFPDPRTVDTHIKLAFDELGYPEYKKAKLNG